MIDLLNTGEAKPKKYHIFLFPFLGVLIFTLAASGVLELVLRNWYLKKVDNDLHQVIQTTIEAIARTGIKNEQINAVVALYKAKENGRNRCEVADHNDTFEKNYCLVLKDANA